VLEASGVHDILTKSQGSNNLLNVAMATLTALKSLKSPVELAAMRGMDINKVRPFWERRKPEPKPEPSND
jgi:small subunit ribosomal protein S5